ncbi:MAG: hypothetical protein R2761_18910 [Acidimicrobiales bacterium]
MSEQGQILAEEAGLVYVEDGGPGYARRRLLSTGPGRKGAGRALLTPEEIDLLDFLS